MSDNNVVEVDLEQPQDPVTEVVASPPKPKRKAPARKRRRKAPEPDRAHTNGGDTEEVAAGSAPGEDEATVDANGARGTDGANGAKANGTNGEASASVESLSEAPRRRKRRKLSGSLRDLLPSAESVKIYKKDKLGKQSLIRGYTARDIMRSGDVESFIQEHLLETYKGGDYTVDLVNHNGKVTHTVDLGFADPPGAGTKNDDASREAIRLAYRQTEQLQSKLEKLEAGKQDPLEMLAKAKEILGEKPDTNLAALLMQNQQAGGGVAELRQDLRDFMRSMEEALKKRSAPAPAPILPKEDDNKLADVVKFMGEQMQQQQQQAQQQFQLQLSQQQQHQETILKLITEQNSSKTSSATEAEKIRAEMKEMQARYERQLMEQQKQSEIQRLESKFDQLQRELQQGGGDPLEDLFSKAEALVTLSERLSGKKKDNADSFWGFLNNFIHNAGDVSGALERVVESIREGQQQVGGSSGGEAKQLPAGSGFPDDVPDDAAELVDKIESSEDEAESLRNVFLSLQALAQHGAWRGSIQPLFQHAMQGRREQALKGIRDYLQHLADMGRVSGERAQKVLDLIEQNYEMIVAQLKASVTKQ